MLKKIKSETEKTIIEYYDDESSRATEFRRLAKNVRHYSNPTEVRSILVTSAAKHEGKSIIAANLAIAISKSEDDKKVLLVDCDLRRPVIHSLFCMKRDPGLSSLLEEKDDPDDVIQDTKLDNLQVITSGYVASSPSQLLENSEAVMEKLKGRFDVLICDAPPVVPVDDAGMLVPYVDGVLLVVMAGKTDRMVVKRAADILEESKAKILGIALNNMHGSLPYYYDYGYYRYKYDMGDKK